MRKVVLAGSAILLLVIILVPSIYRVSFNSDDYNILIINRHSGLGYGIVCKGKFEIWQIAKTVHGGIAEKPIYCDRRWWN